MKRFSFLLSIIFSVQIGLAQDPCVDGLVLGEFPCHLVDQMSFMHLQDLNIETASQSDGTNDIWGWVDPTDGTEYALVGQKNGLSIVDISDPINPVLMGHMPTNTTSSTWRDMKVYQDHVFVVSEAGGHGMQVYDLTQLSSLTPPMTLEPDTVYEGFGSAHNIVINEESGYAYGVGTDSFSGGLHIVDISDPVNPVLAGSFESDGYTHDAQVVIYNGPDADYAGSEIAFASNEDNVAIVDVTDKSDCQLISHASYPDPGYTHQSWLTEDQRYMVVNDETDETSTGNNTRTFIFDVQDLDNPIYLGYYESALPASDHNQYLKGNFDYQSNYAAGLRILDIADIENANLYEVAYFDVFPDHDNAGFPNGTWSNYCYFPSGVVAVTSRTQGVHFLMPTLFSVDPATASVMCEDELEFELSILADLQGTFTVGQEGLPENVVVTADSFEAPGSVTVTLSNFVGIESGQLIFDFILESEFGAYPVKAQISVSGTYPIAPALEEPVDMALLDDGTISYVWSEQANADFYSLEVFSDEAMTVMEYSDIVPDPSTIMDFPLMDGTYYWRVKSMANCGESDWSETLQFTISTVGVEEKSSANFGLFPNPTSNQLTVVAKSSLGVVSLFDTDGRLVRSDVVQGDRLTLDISNLAKGVYMIQVLGQTKRVIKL